MVITYSKGKVANPGRGQLNKENVFSLSPFAPEHLVSRDGFGSPVPRLLISMLRLSVRTGAVLRQTLIDYPPVRHRQQWQYSIIAVSSHQPPLAPKTEILSKI